MSQANNATGVPEGKLTEKEKDTLRKEVEKSVKQLKIILLFAYISIILVIGLILVPAVYIAIRKEKQKSEAINQDKLKVYEIKGVLSRRDVGVKTPMYSYMVDGQIFKGEALGLSDVSGIESMLGKKVTVQYIPEISKNRLFKNTDGQGYNFILKIPVV